MQMNESISKEPSAFFVVHRQGAGVGSVQGGTEYKAKLIGVTEKRNGLSLVLIPGLWIFSVALEMKNWEGAEPLTEPITRAKKQTLLTFPVADWEASVKLQEVNKT